MILDKINKPNDIKNLTKEEVLKLPEEIREFLIENISRTGGHLASNLGTVELTIALHLLCDFPEDKIIFDVGHQSYTHKILTGRKDGFANLRSLGGMSGFPKRSESPCDSFDTGHSSTSIAAALGFAAARDMKGENHKVIAVIGDGSLTGGLALEAINTLSTVKKNVMVVLNDNEMSIGENVGALSLQLSKLRTSNNYTELKDNVQNSLEKIPVYGDKIVQSIRRTKSGIKQLVVPGMAFEELGIMYLGPVDGHDIYAMYDLFKQASNFHGPVLIHVKTKKGKGFSPAVRHPERFHGTDPFDKETGLPLKKKVPGYTDIFSTVMRKMGDRDEKIVAITAAMADGTGLRRFRNMFPDRFFDVGIAEEYAVTFASALAMSGYKPVFAVYSSFLQRGFDQV
ncbi:MAG: 1-deoxy-D-xylulose-5-phosphate synthase, partial [Lachnospiraceae bacterium]|nr:1-deoxy-D-xylulose-5-phosphate synthase [Lachnospiraceae bacterium]